MINISNKSECCGCHSCANICPKDAIKMLVDKEGFLYPKIDKEKCVDCGLCDSVCHTKLNVKSTNTAEAYACYNVSEKVRENSSSGGVFTLVAEKIIEKGGVVFGAAFDEEFNVCHIAVETKDELSKLRGSKYLQSTIGYSYRKVKEYLDEDKYVLFSGTPCQIDGLLNYLKKDYSKLYTQDIICHGAPSPYVWQKYLEFLKKKVQEDVKTVSFRSKKSGWKDYSMFIKFSNDKEYSEIFRNDFFMKGFLANLYLRPSCYNCKSKSLERRADITLADFWGIEKVIPSFSDNKGISLVFFNTPKGRKFFEEISTNLVFEKTDINQAVRYNVCAYKSVGLNDNRKVFFKNIDKIPFDKLVEKCMTPSFFRRVVAKIKSIIKKC